MVKALVIEDVMQLTRAWGQGRMRRGQAHIEIKEVESYLGRVYMGEM